MITKWSTLDNKVSNKQSPLKGPGWADEYPAHFKNGEISSDVCANRQPNCYEWHGPGVATLNSINKFSWQISTGRNHLDRVAGPRAKSQQQPLPGVIMTGWSNLRGRSVQINYFNGILLNFLFPCTKNSLNKFWTLGTSSGWWKDEK